MNATGPCSIFVRVIYRHGNGLSSARYLLSHFELLRDWIVLVSKWLQFLSSHSSRLIIRKHGAYPYMHSCISCSEGRIIIIITLTDSIRNQFVLYGYSEIDRGYVSENYG